MYLSTLQLAGSKLNHIIYNFVPESRMDLKELKSRLRILGLIYHGWKSHIPTPSAPKKNFKNETK